MKNTVIKGIFTVFIVFGLIFNACETNTTETDSSSQITGVNLTGNITITADNGLTTGAELTAVYTGTEAISYQWNKDNSAIPAAVSKKYIPPIAGRYTVTISAEGYNSKTSAAVNITGEPLPPLTGTVYIDVYGTIEVGQILRVYTRYLNGDYGTFSYQWNRGGTPIFGANGQDYIVQSADIGSTISVTVTCSGYSGSITSDPTATVPPVPPLLTGTVSITGNAWVRDTLTANINNLNGDGTIIYQWKRITNDYYGDVYYETIGINSNVYVVQPADIGLKIIVIVSRSGNSGSITSEPVGPVTDPSLPPLTGTVSITGIAEIGQTLTANTSNLDGNGTISYQWKRGTTDIGTNKKSYFLQYSDADSAITVTVSRSGNYGSITSEPVQITIGTANQYTPGLAFTLNNNGTAYSVSKGTATANEVVIPSFYNELPVIEIPAQGFVGMNMTSIKIPNTITSIGKSAFYGCSSLTSMIIPFVNSNFGYIFGASNYYDQNSYIPPSLKTVVITGGTSISYDAFYGCSDLTSITIPSSVTSISESAFYGCSGLMSITIPASVTSIGSYAFYDCNNLTSVSFETNTVTISNTSSFPGDLRNKYLSYGAGTYTRPSGDNTWTKQ